MTSPEVEVNNHYQALLSAEPIHQDHYVRLLVEKLAEKGKTTTGLGLTIILVMTATMKVQLSYPKHLSRRVRFLVSDVDDPTDYHTRRVALAETEVEGKELALASVHLSWWDKGFQEEWARFEAVLKRVEQTSDFSR